MPFSQKECSWSLVLHCRVQLQTSAVIKQQQATVRVSVNAPQATVTCDAMQGCSRPHPKLFRTNSTTSQLVGVDGVIETNIHMSAAPPRTTGVNDA